MCFNLIALGVLNEIWIILMVFVAISNVLLSNYVYIYK